jgi:hypothetical protein
MMMRTIINYKVDKVILENAVRRCIHKGIVPNIKNTKVIINNVVLENGLSALKFPEHWYTYDEEIMNYPQGKIDAIVERLFLTFDNK